MLLAFQQVERLGIRPESEFAGSLTAGGQRLAEGLVTLKEPVTDLSLLRQRPTLNLLQRSVVRRDRA